MPGSWADGAAGAAGCAGGVGWFWRGGWEGDWGWFIARTQLSALREGRGCWCVWGTAGSHWDLDAIGKGKHPSPRPVGDTAARDRVMLRQVLWHPASIGSREVLPLNPQEPGSPARRALLPFPYLLPAPEWSWMWSHAPKNHQHQGTTGTLSNSIPCYE